MKGFSHMLVLSRNLYNDIGKRERWARMDISELLIRFTSTIRFFGNEDISGNQSRSAPSAFTAPASWRCTEPCSVKSSQQWFGGGNRNRVRLIKDRNLREIWHCVSTLWISRLIPGILYHPKEFSCAILHRLTPTPLPCQPLLYFLSLYRCLFQNATSMESYNM